MSVSQSTDRGPSHRSVEMAVAIAAALFGAVVMIGSLQAGIGWAIEGPRAGFFPFYVGLMIVLSSAINLARAYSESKSSGMFASWEQLRSVMSVLIPTAIYVSALPYLGIYVTSLFLIGGFMKWLGRYSWGRTLLISVGIPLLTYLTFERWFLVPLPKGPLEDFLGL